LAIGGWVRHGDCVIASVSFRKFKALRSTQLKLAPCNLVLGPSGSGKTSLIEAVLRLRTLARLPLAQPGAAPGAATKAGGPEIHFHFEPPFAGISARMSCQSELICDLLEVRPAGDPGWPALKEKISRFRGYLLDHYAMAMPAAETDGSDLRSNGANLAAVLRTRRERAPAEFAQLVAEVIRILPEFTAVEFLPAGPGLVQLAMRLQEGDEVVAADNLSQGTLYTLAFLTLAFDPAPPTVICLEEVDRGIHPRALREVRDALYRLSYPEAYGLKREPVQVIATTHSPHLLDLFRDHPEEIVISHKQGRAAHFERLSDRPDLADLLQEGSLGDMWFSGILGGVPEE
jgi:predicted ATPase